MFRCALEKFAQSGGEVLVKHRFGNLGADVVPPRYLVPLGSVEGSRLHGSALRDSLSQAGREKEMARLEDLTPGAKLHGLLPGHAVTIVQVEWPGTSAVTITYRDDTRQPGNELLYRDDVARIIVEAPGSAWAFDGDPDLFKLVSEALRDISYQVPSTRKRDSPQGHESEEQQACRQESDRCAPKRGQLQDGEPNPHTFLEGNRIFEPRNG